ncbi:MAG: DUF4416 family protein [Candidatus Ancaeobacter aquaticus]|nr:DUF4416 family protein [Candidatus Ancaeobacter aquaticus]
MGEAVIPAKVKLIAGLLSIDQGHLTSIKNALIDSYGEIDCESEIIPFRCTNYYNDEMGDNILRQYIAFGRLVCPGDIADIKIHSNVLEDQYTKDGRRQVNIDPGLIDQAKMILATTKDATYRVYIARGIYAQPTLYYEDKTCHGYSWTYSDYKSEKAIHFFNKARNIYRKLVKEGKL